MAKASAASLPGEGLEMNIGLLGGGVPHRIDDDHRAGRLLQPLLVLVRRGRPKGLAPQTTMLVRILGGTWVEADHRGADRA